VDENDALYHRIHGGDRAAIKEMIERNTPLVLSRVGNFLKEYHRFNHLKDDLVSEGYLSLTRTVNKFTTDTVEKPTGQIVFELDKAFGNYIDQELGEGMMSNRTVQRRRQSKNALPGRLHINIDSPPANLWSHAEGRVIRKHILDENGPQDNDKWLGSLENVHNESKLNSDDGQKIVQQYTSEDSTSESDLFDALIACCECEEDEMILTLRVKGYTDAEIGGQLGLAQQTVNVRRLRICERYEEKYAN
jgi:RNA polymerase sigma factor (sigma-70 family)